MALAGLHPPPQPPRRELKRRGRLAKTQHSVINPRGRRKPPSSGGNHGQGAEAQQSRGQEAEAGQAEGRRPGIAFRGRKRSLRRQAEIGRRRPQAATRSASTGSASRATSGGLVASSFETITTVSTRGATSARSAALVLSCKRHTTQS